jgi:hypothetical protein
VDSRPELLTRPLNVGEECVCCHLKFVGMGRLRHCPSCLHHRGGPGLQLDKEHISAWRAYAAQFERDASDASVKWGQMLKAKSDELAERDAKVLELQEVVRVGIVNLPAEVIAAHVQGVEVAEAHGARDSAFRRRDAAMRVIWRLEQEHNRPDEAVHECACGEPNCYVERTLHPFVDDLFDWESREKQRLDDDKQDGLPDEHPAVRKAARRGRHPND